MMSDTLKSFDSSIQRIKNKNIESYKTFDELKLVVDSKHLNSNVP